MAMHLARLDSISLSLCLHNQHPPLSCFSAPIYLRYITRPLTCARKRGNTNTVQVYMCFLHSRRYFTLYIQSVALHLMDAQTSVEKRKNSQERRIDRYLFYMRSSPFSITSCSGVVYAADDSSSGLRRILRILLYLFHSRYFASDFRIALCEWVISSYDEYYPTKLSHCTFTMNCIAPFSIQAILFTSVVKTRNIIIS